MFLKLESVILRLHEAEFLALATLLILFLAYLIYFSYASLRRFRFIHGTATSKIRSAAQGHVELKGLAEWMPNDTIFSPFSNSRCIWYHCTIEKKQGSGKKVAWTHILDECSHHLFHLVDDTGQCIIDPESAHVIAETDLSWRGRSSDDRFNPPKATPWLASVCTGEFRFRERLIRPATQLYALGWFRSFSSEPSTQWIQNQIDDLIRQWKLQPGKYLSGFDFDQNGKIQDQEWKAIRTLARKQVLARINSENREQHIMSKPEDKNYPYILSAKGEDQLIARKKWQAWLSLSAVLLLFVALTILFSIRAPVSL